MVYPPAFICFLGNVQTNVIIIPFFGRVDLLGANLHNHINTMQAKNENENVPFDAHINHSIYS